MRADGSLAKGARQRALLEAEGVPFRGERVDMRVARLPRRVSRRCGSSGRSRCARARAASTWSPRGASRRCPSCATLRVGLAHLFIRHTSASLTLNENASPDVRRDFESWFNDAVPEDAPYWTHTIEGPDDMPAHIKASLLGPSLTLPVSRRPARARHVAGHLPVRAPRPRRRALAGRDRVRRVGLRPTTGCARPAGASRRTPAPPRARPRTRTRARRSRPGAPRRRPRRR